MGYVKWKCSDRQGRFAYGLTKQHARNQYYIQYLLSAEPEIPELDITAYMQKIGENDGGKKG